MNIIKLNGLDKKLYQLVAPLVMDPEILKANNNYPFKTSREYTWFILIHNRQVKGFIPIEKRNNRFIINNYYIKDNRNEFLNLLLTEVIRSLGDKRPLWAIALMHDQNIFEESGFVVDKEWKLYLKMHRVVWEVK